jgi:nicotinamidase-related amidase
MRRNKCLTPVWALASVNPSQEVAMQDRFEDHAWKDVVSSEDLELYRHYRRELRLGQRPALLLIDLYNMAYQGGPGRVHEITKKFPSACGDFAWNAIEPTKRLLNAARARGLPVVYSTGETRREVRTDQVRATHRRSRAPKPEDFQIFDAFKPEPGDLVIYKERASAFFGTPLSAHLTQWNVDSLIVCGESTSGCVRASVVDGYSHGFHVALVEECTYDRSLLSHKVNLFDMHHKYADVMHLEEVEERLQAFPER